MDTGAATMEAAAVTGRAVPLQMGRVRVGGSGRPVRITGPRGDASHEGDDTATDHRRPARVVLEPHPRRPFVRKAESTAVGSLALGRSNTQVNEENSNTAAAAHASVAASDVRLHAKHHGTRRTSVAAVLGQVNEERRREVEEASTATQTGDTVAVKKRKVSKPSEGVSHRETKRATASDRFDVDQELFARLTSRTQASQPAQRSFHQHEEVQVAFNSDRPTGDRSKSVVERPRASVWRDVDESIDRIYEDPSIDIVQLQLLSHKSTFSAARRRDVERKRLRIAAAEIHQTRYDVAKKKIEETVRRKEQIAKLSKEIRLRNKSSLKSATRDSEATVKAIRRRSIEERNILERKPPVPRLSRVGGNSKSTSRRLKPKTNTTPQGNGRPTTGDNEVESDVEATRVSPSKAILLDTLSGGVDVQHSVAAAPRIVRRRKRPADLDTSNKVSHQATPPEKVQRRAVAREYMQLQKQSRRLVEAKQEEQRRLEEARRKMQLQRLEEIRLRGLETARRKRIRQKQRDRTTRRKREDAKMAQVSSSPESSPDIRSTPPLDENAENENYRANSQGEAGSVSKSEATDGDARNVVFCELRSPDPRVSKLRALEEQAKRLAIRLQQLKDQRSPSPHRSTAPDCDKSVSSESHDESQIDADASDGEIHGIAEREIEFLQSSSESVDVCSSQASMEDILDRDNLEDTRFDRMRSNGAQFIDAALLGVELDFASVGAQSVKIVWPPCGIDDEESGVISVPVEDRFELLSSDSSSSSSSSRSSRLQSSASSERSDSSLNEQENEFDEQAKMSIASHGPAGEALDGDGHQVVDGRVNGSLDRQVSSFDELLSQRWPARSMEKERICSFAKRTHTIDKPDAELLRLIRETDDNLSIIDREAKRLFRLQQERIRKRREETERIENEKLQARLRRDHGIENHETITTHNSSNTCNDAERTHVKEEEEEEELNSRVNYEKLESIVEFAQCSSEKPDSDFEVPERAISEGAPADSKSSTFWDNQIMRSGGGVKQQVLAQVRGQTPIDRTDLVAQHEHQLEEDDENDIREPERLLSPRALANQMLAAVDYHEAIHEAHLQLAMIERAHVLEQVQQDTIALAQAFKEEMESNLTAQQLVEEHDALAFRFDEDLHEVVTQLESVRNAEQQEREVELKNLEEASRLGRLRETSAQTEIPALVDVATSARMVTDTAVTTDHERVDAAVQFTDERADASVQHEDLRVDAGVQHTEERASVGIQHVEVLIDSAVQHTEERVDTGVQYSDSRVEAAVQHADTCIDASVQYSDDRVDAGVQHGELQVDTGVQHAGVGIDAGIQYDNVQVDMGVQHSDMRVDTGVQHAETCIDAAVQFIDSRAEAGVQCAEDRADAGIQHEEQRTDAAVQHAEDRADFGSQYEETRVATGIQYDERRVDTSVQHEEVRVDMAVQHEQFYLDAGTQHDLRRVDTSVQPEALYIDAGTQHESVHIEAAIQHLENRPSGLSVSFMTETAEEVKKSPDDTNPSSADVEVVVDKLSRTVEIMGRETEQEQSLILESHSQKDTRSTIQLSQDQLDPHDSSFDEVVTQSIELQQNRVEGLKGMIEARKIERVALQRQLMIEEKKSILREAESRLLDEAGVLETKMVADEHSLVLSRQRAKLELLELESRQDVLRAKISVENGLLFGYDYCEDVEPVKDPIVKHDMQVQARVGGDISADNETDSIDFLLGYDYVEVVECSVSTTDTSTLLPVEKHALHAEKINRIDTPTKELFNPPSQSGQNIDAIVTVDLLSNYDYVEQVKSPDTTTDMLSSFDYIELAEHVEEHDSGTPDSVVDEAQYDILHEQEGLCDRAEIDADFAHHDAETFVELTDMAEGAEETATPCSVSAQGNECRIDMEEEAPHDGEGDVNCVADMILGRFLREAIKDIQGAPDRRRQASVNLGVRSTQVVESSAHEEDAVEDSSSINQLPLERVDPSEQLDGIVERIFENLRSAAVRDGVQLHLNRYISKQPATRDTSPVNPLPIMHLDPYRDAARDIIDGLQVSSGQVVLPSRPDRVLAGRNDSIIAAYDAVSSVVQHVYRQLGCDPSYQRFEGVHDIQRQLLVGHVHKEMDERVWKPLTAAEDELAQFSRKLRDEEQGDVDEDDLRLLRAQQRTPISSLIARFQDMTMGPVTAAVDLTASAPGHRPLLGRRRSGSLAVGSPATSASWLLQQEEQAVVERMTESIWQELVSRELGQAGRSWLYLITEARKCDR